jgi:hypothetical protein
LLNDIQHNNSHAGLSVSQNSNPELRLCRPYFCRHTDQATLWYGNTNPLNASSFDGVRSFSSVLPDAHPGFARYLTLAGLSINVTSSIAFELRLEVYDSNSIGQIITLVTTLNANFFFVSAYIVFVKPANNWLWAFNYSNHHIIQPLVSGF